jgi:PTH1 family peptidyl-tRNA hydrolase
MSSDKCILVAGLGNPGSEYSNTRHNIGFQVIEKLSEKYNIQLSKNKFQTIFGKGRIEGKEAILAMPQAFMNRSGLPLMNLSSFFKAKCEDFLVIYDDIDLPLKKFKIKPGGGHGGHNGMRSIVDAFGSSKIPRLRVGVGRPEKGRDVAKHVLGKFSVEEAEIIPEVLQISTDAVGIIIREGITKGMNNINCL